MGATGSCLSAVDLSGVGYRCASSSDCAPGLICQTSVCASQGGGAPWDGGPLVDAGSTWRYLDDGTDLGTAWREPDFNDSSWASARSAIGYGATKLETEIPASDGGHYTTYFRFAWMMTRVPLGDLLVRVRRDDGAAVYINGLEVFRTNLKEDGGTIVSTTPATTHISLTVDEERYVEGRVAASSLVQGRNVVAVEVHQPDLGGHDMAFDLELRAAP